MVGGKPINMLDNIFSAIVQLLLFMIIPFVWWIVTSKGKVRFFEWIGLKKIQTNNYYRLLSYWILILLGLFMVAFFIMPFIVSSEDSATTSQFYGKGIKVLASALIYSYIQTGLAEEIFFRGFLAKRLIAKFKFLLGNITQAFIFGLLHGILLYQTIGLIKAIFVVLITGTIGWFEGYLNEKQSGGSIVTSWLLHGTTNLLAALSVMFI